jgi:hypothetical protein
VKFLRFNGGTKVTVECSFDAKGFCEVKESAIFLQKLYADIKFFENNLKINQIQNTKVNTLVKSTKVLSLSPEKQPHINFNFQNGAASKKEIAN